MSKSCAKHARNRKRAALRHNNKLRKAKKHQKVKAFVESVANQGFGALRSLALEVGVPAGHVYNDCGPEKLKQRTISYMLLSEGE
jgi:hypothetical protein